jgi:small subunit ribosomal protein S7
MGHINKRLNIYGKPVRYSEEDFNFEKYKTQLFRILIGCFVKKGKKKLAEKIFLDVCYQLKLKFQLEPHSVFSEVLTKLRPTLGVKPRKRGAVVYKLPTIMRESQQNSLTIRWLVQSVFEKKGFYSSFSDRFLSELMDLYTGKQQAGAIRKKDELHRTAFLNRPFLR